MPGMDEFGLQLIKPDGKAGTGIGKDLLVSLLGFSHLKPLRKQVKSLCTEPGFTLVSSALWKTFISLHRKELD